jgi:alpha-D-ribose 1-methylphosphonate 5-triphosphate synthase subunit PhnG
MIVWQNIEKTRAVIFGVAGASGVLFIPGTTTLWRCVVGLCIVAASVAYGLTRG